MSTLYVVPTPIGNLEDITLRALRILKEADFVLAEDTRTTGQLLKHYEISNQLISHHIHNEHKTVERMVDQIKSAKSAAIVSDAGTPSISDPGFLLVRACIENDINVVCLPGPSAIIPAIVGCGFPCDSFIFEGFLPHKKGRQTKWKAIAEEPKSVVLYESPHRLKKALKEMVEFLAPNRQICVAREISKLHENFHRGTAAELLEYFEEKPPKGEIVIVISAKTKEHKND
ncbi:16S rRNA (cytidine(1402)-2'-O)-methyltransferase [Brumimicrobium aurantiacum]|uniref:Ribosomal RNA small subunit methyltransferase I n=1 Tax=Brumimicrobium aurantiacum TaxID=1737063 RepID=A0A3E1F2F5_9FLAO|nr:16S rRNA (cytidine(1402)-2'-O)-methyltransferase [Brumimicrobium aurantiacum]RFC55897.1 16S rRNA (cytidine(1402)-2'-O)-methyltransferase [Brumimicrobium aurantiacum]